MRAEGGIRLRVETLVRRIPRGQVATYGDVARMAGSPRAAREVGWAMASLPPDSDVPWWRVINRYGEISCRSNGTTRQAELLRSEGVEIDEHGRIDLERFRWDGDDGEDTP